MESFETASPVQSSPTNAPAARTPTNLNGPAVRLMSGPASSHEPEKSLLSCCLIDGSDVLIRCLGAGISPLHFDSPAHRIVYGTLLDLHAAQKPTDVIVLCEELRISKKLDEVGGYEFITQISSSQATTAQAEYFIGRVIDHYRLREMIRGAQGILEACGRFAGDFSDISPRIEHLAGVLTVKDSARTWAQAVEEARKVTLERMKPPMERKMDGAELPWGIPDMDRYFGPLEPGELVVIGGYTSSGKSSLLRQILWGLAEANYASLLETVEVRDAEEAINLAAHMSGLRSRARLDEMHRRDQEKLLSTFDRMKTDNFSVVHTDHSMAAMHARVQAFKRKKKLRAWGADYLQILEDIKNLRPGEREDMAIGRVTAGMKRFSTNEEVVTFLLSGFNRAYAMADFGRDPKLSDLAGSSHIEKDASRVLLIHVPTEYSIGGNKMSQSLTADSNEQPRFFVKLLQCKGRNNGTASIGMFFHRETKTFHAIARSQS